MEASGVSWPHCPHGESVSVIFKNVKGEFVNKHTTPKLIAYNGKMPTNNMIKCKSWEYPCFQIRNVDVQIIDWMWLTKAGLSIWFKWTPQQNMNQTNTATRCKSNNAAQDDEQLNTAIIRRNHEKTQKKKLDICKNHLINLKQRKKNANEWF